MLTLKRNFKLHKVIVICNQLICSISIFETVYFSSLQEQLVSHFGLLFLTYFWSTDINTDSCHVVAQPHMRYTSAVIAAIMLKFWFEYCARFHFSSTSIYPHLALLMYSKVFHHISVEVPNDSTRSLRKTEYRAFWIPSSTAVCGRKQDGLYTMPIFTFTPL